MINMTPTERARLLKKLERFDEEGKQFRQRFEPDLVVFQKIMDIMTGALHLCSGLLEVIDSPVARRSEYFAVADHVTQTLKQAHLDTEELY